MAGSADRFPTDFKTPQSTVFRLVKEATNDFPARRERLERGYDDEVYKVDTYEETTYIVRIRHYSEVPFSQEAWALELARQMGVPAPKVLLASESIIDGLPRDVMVQEYLPGEPLSDRLPEMTEEQKAAVFAQAGAALAKLHRIPVGGFYHRHSGGVWDFTDWESMLESLIRSAADAPLPSAPGFSQEDAEKALTLLSIYRSDFPCEQPVLCHGDFHPAHLLVNSEGSLTGLMDMGNFQGAPPVHDLAALVIEYPEMDLSWLKAGYGPAPWWEDDSFPRRLLLHKTLLLLGYLAYYIEEDLPEEAEAVARSLKITLDEWAD